MLQVLQILELYRRIYEELLAIPVIKGKKSEPEKFAGGLYTTTVEVSYVLKYIGVMVMVHGDDKGLVLPPKVAFIQVVVVSVLYKAADTKGIFDACSVSVNALTRAGFRVEADWSENHSPGWKYSPWEMKGVRLRIEIGPRDLANNRQSLCFEASLLPLPFFAFEQYAVLHSSV
ncbi:hypothetical protein ACLOJK_002339 [Asimina triloba]